MIVRGTSRGLPPPRPVVTAMYCLPPDAERHRESLHRRAEPRLPQHLAGLHVERAERAIEIADERRRRRRSTAPRSGTARAARVLHTSFIVVDVEGRELADVAVGAGHLEEAAAGAGAARAVLLRDRARPSSPCTTG